MLERGFETCLQVGCNLKKHLQRDGSQPRPTVVPGVRWSCHVPAFGVFKRVVE
jgi:hypothetical protein